MSEREVTIARLRRGRPKNRLARWTLLALAALVAGAWTSGVIELGDFWSPRRLANLRRFLSVDAVPYPLRDGPFELAALVGWAREILSARGLPGALATLWISILAIGLAGLWSVALAPLAARSLTRAEPYLPGPRAAGGLRLAGWRLLRASAAWTLIAMRAIPEYILAFLLLAALGPTAWPAILALAIHNTGILGRLTAESIENLESPALASLRGLGAGRANIALAAVAPLVFGRFLLYFFYRLETCVREATVLGMLGVVSLGYWIQEARARQFYDEMLLLVALGALIVLVGDILSVLARRAIRGST